MGRVAQGGHRPRRPRARAPAARAHGRADPPRRRAPAVRADHRIHQHHPAARSSRRSPGDATMEWRIRSIIRWNAMAMVVRANRKPGDLGGHIASFASSATLYDVGFNHFWRAPERRPPGRPALHPGPQLAGHLRARLPRRPHQRIAARQLPHGSRRPRHQLLPAPVADAGLLADADRVSMGLGPIAAIYQARFWKYLEGRGLMPKTDRKVWCFLGDGETDEPESLGAISRRRPRRPRQPGLRHQLQPAAPRRPGARQRQDHPGARRRLPRRRLERDQG